MPEDTEETFNEGDWFSIRQASEEYGVAYSWLYRMISEQMANNNQGDLELRFVITGPIKREVLISRKSLDAWQEKRPERFKKKRSERPGRQEVAIAS